MPAPTPVNAECYITARMTMNQVLDYERHKAVLQEQFPDWEQRGAWFAWQQMGDQFFEGGLTPANSFELGMMFVLQQQGKL